jgi:hypothetical protein
MRFELVLEKAVNIEEVIERFGNLNQACIALGIASQNMTKWKNKGYIPYLQQYRIAELTEGDLLPDDVNPLLKKQGKA